jgi:GNAT superfamily N-acetyltransferase
MGKLDSTAATAARLRRIVASDDHFVAVASRGEDLIGYAWAHDRGPHLRSGFRTVRLNDLYVDVTHRRRGAGRMLFSAARDWAQRRGARWMEWQASGNALAFYERLGLTGDACPDLEHPFFEIDFGGPDGS